MAAILNGKPMEISFIIGFQHVFAHTVFQKINGWLSCYIYILYAIYHNIYIYVCMYVCMYV